jgi:membrane protease YdiL (CAAX protease family)
MSTLQLGLISLIVALGTGVRVFVPQWPSLRDVGLAIVAFGGTVLLSLPSWRRAVSTLASHVARWLPRNRSELVQWAGICVIIGTCEELSWRGVQFTLLLRLFGSWPAAALVCSIMFGVLHIWQGRRWIYASAALALVLQGLVWATGSLYAAMTVHMAIDFTAGIYLSRHWPRSSYPFVAPEATG